MFRGLRREAPPRRPWGRQRLSLATVGFLCAGVLVVVGATPAAAKKAPRTGHAQTVFSHPAESSPSNSFCQPKVNKPCPQSNTVWSGYVVSPESGHQITTVSASWVQSAVTCPKPNAWVLFWTGIDGWSQIGNATVEQGGSSAQCVGGGSPVQYMAWWEMYPTNEVQTVFPIAVGDHITSSVVFSSVDRTYTVTVTDDTSGHSFVVVCSVPDNAYTITVDGVTTGPTSFADTPGAVLCSPGAPCQNSSGEWVVEAPGGNGGGLYPLAHFRPFVFKAAHAVDTAGHQGPIPTNGWLFTALDLKTVSGIDEANVKGLTNHGSSFRVVWSRSQP